MKDESEKTTLKLAEEKLKIPKEVRLTGKDGFIQLPAVPDLFYMNEVVTWLVNLYQPNAENLIRYGDYPYDYTIEAKGYSRLEKVPASISKLAPGQHTVKNSKRITLVEVYQGLNEQQLFKPNLELHEYQRHSFSHQRFLYRILNGLYNHSGVFMSVLAERMGVPIKTTDEFYPIALKCLTVIQTSLQNEEVKGSFRIPELYAFRDHGVLMSYSLNEAMQFESEEWGLLYTYRFSKTTSYHFLTALKDFLALLARRYESLEIAQSIQGDRAASSIGIGEKKVVAKMDELIKAVNEKSQEREDYLSKRVDGLVKLLENSATEKVDDSLIKKPANTKEKIKLIQELLNISKDANDDSEDEMDVISKMILIKALSEQNIFRKKLSKYQLGIVYHILTGNSYDNFERKFPKDNIDWDVLKAMYKTPTSKTKAIAAMEKLIKTLKDELLPYLEKLKS